MGSSMRRTLLAIGFVAVGAAAAARAQLRIRRGEPAEARLPGGEPGHFGLRPGAAVHLRQPRAAALGEPSREDRQQPGSARRRLSRYDARGHATRRVDGDNDLTFVYDKAERLTQVRQTGTGACVTSGTGPRCLKSFTYAPANGTTPAGQTDWKQGKLTSASRFNYLGAPFNATVEVQETYQYAGRGGRLSQKETINVTNGAQREAFRQTFAWDEDGALESHTYPDCVTPALCGSAPRTQEYGYTRGRLTSVASFANPITYDPSGLIKSVTRTNNTTDFQTADPFGMGRPSEIYALRTNDTFGLWTTGAYKYDGSGNVWKTGSSTYLYDAASRIVSGTVYSGPYSGGASTTQTYTYDTFGNLTSTTTAGTTVQTPAATATNRLTAGTYDDSGNLTAWSGNTYEYDAFDQMTRHVSNGEDWRYMYTADDERFWAYRYGGTGSIWTLRGPDGKVLREYNAHLGWSNYRDTIYRGGTLLATATAAGGAVTHLHTDHLGTPRLLTDATGSPATAQYHAYHPYGQELATTYTSTHSDRLRFTGHERDLVNPGGQGDDLDYMHARHYSPVVGRFLSFDPIGGDPANPQSWNRYAYVLGNPLRYVDPQGLHPLEGYYYGQGVFASTGVYSSNTADHLFFGGLQFAGLVEAAGGAPTPGAEKDFAAQVFANVWAQAGWVAQAADQGATVLDFLTGWVSAADGLIHGDPREAGLLTAVAMIPGSLDNATLAVVGTGPELLEALQPDPPS